MEVGRLAAADLTAGEGETSADVRKRIREARERQERRLSGSGLSCNAEMGPKEVAAAVTFSAPARKMALDAFSRMKLSARAYYRALKVAASIADLDGSPRVEEEHLAEAVSYRQRL